MAKSKARSNILKRVQRGELTAAAANRSLRKLELKKLTPKEVQKRAASATKRGDKGVRRLQ